MTIRSATIADAQALTAIYAYYVENTPITFETEVPSVQEFAERIAKTLKRYPYLVAEEAGEIVGYAYASAYKERAAYDWTVEVTVYLAPDAKAKGLGTALYQALEEKLKAQNVVNLTACITGGNQQSEAFHEKLGYRKVADFAQVGYKFNQWHDVIWMQKEMQWFPEKVPAFIPNEKA
ncbi:GNAT family N-acetyltransferase [Enterococcus casseliflavus]|uniref:GNAT family N-acetyltransferase n=1 Tax=Enterococcus casseliflavus TaxID=37734 RepID=UPI0022E272D5|nr:GNAT family N-acetyltransferase [Enterococcus casseliflavus]